jgi:4-carboxymuconolactone decarboxylase
MGTTPEAVRQLLLASADEVPAEIRDQWLRHVDETVLDVWERPTLSPRYRSIVTVAALATRNSSSELCHQVRVALRHGLSRVELCEVMLQVTGYGGLGVGLDGMRALKEVFDENPALGAPPQDLAPAIEGDSRWERSQASFGAIAPDLVELLFDHISPYEVDIPAGERTPFDPEGSEWTSWIQGVSFGDFWSRGNITLVERELVTTAVIIALGRHRELESHLKAALLLGLSRQEVAEAIVHLGLYLGFPTAVEAMLQFQRVLVGKDKLEEMQEREAVAEASEG